MESPFQSLFGNASLKLTINWTGLVRYASIGAKYNPYRPQKQQRRFYKLRCPGAMKPLLIKDQLPIKQQGQQSKHIRIWKRETPELADVSPRSSKIHCFSGEKVLDFQINNWIKWDRNQDTLCEINEALKKEDWNTLRSRLCNRISFGTAGLRAPMRAGFDSMNDLVVVHIDQEEPCPFGPSFSLAPSYLHIAFYDGFDSMNELVIVQAAQGLCAYIKEQYPEESSWSERGIVVGFDGRFNSHRFAELTAIVFLSQNFKVYFFQRYIATPFISYTILRLNCLAGVMVTASHNPKQDNGYKVYWTNGAQIIPPHDEGIHQSILNNLQPKEDSWDDTLLCANELLCDPYNNVVPAYFDALKKEMSCPLMEGNGKCSIKFTYTAMHGVGYPFIKLAFAKINLKPVIPVCEQVLPDPEFPTTPMPNPEEGKESLDLSIKTATEKKCQVILANDPDADRLAAAEVIENGSYKLFNGNELGALLAWWSLENYKISNENPDISNCVMISSTVSSKIIKSMAEVEGFTFHETLTGFKWIANKAIEEQTAGKKVLFAFEEAIGFMVSTNVLDKDGISAATHVATMACYLRCKKCMTLQEKLRDIYETYGFHTSIISYCICRDQKLIKKIFTRLRTFDDGQENTYPTSILDGEYEVANVRDLTTGYDSSTPDKKAVLPVSSSTQMITFTFTNGMVITLRTSGTEPKMKYYAEMCGKPEDKLWDELEGTLKRMVTAAVNEFYQPEKNGLQRKPEN